MTSYFQHTLEAIIREFLNPPTAIQPVDPLEVKCTFCHVEPNQQCVTTKGNTAKNFHQIRRKWAGIEADRRAGRCINLMCDAGKVWFQNQSINCPQCEIEGKI